MAHLDAEFGYYPHSLNFTVGRVTVSTLPELEQTVADIEASAEVDGEWIYPGPQFISNWGSISERPYPARVFGLPKTHRIEHGAADGPEHVNFHVWALSFFLGMRVTAAEAGFLDATPIKSGKLVDFVLLGQGLPNGVALAEDYWRRNTATPEQCQRWAAAVHALYLAHYPPGLQFERFIYLYAALDACFAIMKPTTHVPHAKRIEWMCNQFGMPIPDWASAAGTGQAEVAAIRNDAIHEALFMGAPLGFALHGINTNQNLTLEMEALICRFLAALIGVTDTGYLTSKTNTRQRHGLRL